MAQDAQLQVHAVPADIHHEDYAGRSKIELKICSIRDIFFVDALSESDMELIVVMVAAATINKCIL